jgi:hypothetical protein
MTIPLSLSLILAAPIPEVPFVIGDNAIIVEAQVNGRKTGLMFDSGFSGSVKLTDNLNVGPPSGSVTLRDFVGEFKARTVALKSLKIGSTSLNVAGQEIVQIPGESYTMSYGVHCEGILGLEPLIGQTFEINFEKSVFRFHPPETDISQRKPDNKRTFLLRMLPIGTNSIELPVETPTGQRMKLALDTGNAFYATTHRDVLVRVGLWPEKAKPKHMGTSWVASGPVESFQTVLKGLTVFGVPVESSVWSVIDLPSSSADGDGTVGFQFLRNFNITIDMARRRVWLENFTGTASTEPVGDTGIYAFYDTRVKRNRVWRVTPGSAADEAGIKRGDDLLGVDGQELRAMSFRQLRRLMEGAAGSQVTVAISRDGTLFRHELERRYLVNGL